MNKAVRLKLMENGYANVGCQKTYRIVMVPIKKLWMRKKVKPINTTWTGQEKLLNEKFLLKLALLVSVLGLVSLFIISKNIEISDTTIEKITNEEIQGNVQITGKVKEIINRGSVTILTISQESEIEVIAFGNVSLNKGDTVEISGKTSDNEIIADKIEKI